MNAENKIAITAVGAIPALELFVELELEQFVMPKFNLRSAEERAAIAAAYASASMPSKALALDPALPLRRGAEYISRPDQDSACQALQT
ncbi:hypothetical protein FOA52_007132 [Chlamydomonas sp. UWO 241]|nr:hypothetical protein FOA52_007132 [Chlamydomonas sp. UWO 241]